MVVPRIRWEKGTELGIEHGEERTNFHPKGGFLFHFGRAESQSFFF